MKRTQAVALVAGATLGLAGVALGVALSRKEGRDAARALAEQAREQGARMAQLAVEQYQTQAPRAMDAMQTVRAQAPRVAETFGTVREQAPRVVSTLTERLPVGALNGKVQA